MNPVVIPHAYEEHTMMKLGGERINMGFCHHCHTSENMVWHLPGAEISSDGYRFPFQETCPIDSKRVEPAKPGDDCRSQVARNEPWCQHRQEFAIIVYSPGIQRWQELYVCGPCHETLLTFPHVRTSWPLWTDVEEHRAKLFPDSFLREG